MNAVIVKPPHYTRVQRAEAWKESQAYKAQLAAERAKNEVAIKELEQRLARMEAFKLAARKRRIEAKRTAAKVMTGKFNRIRGL